MKDTITAISTAPAMGGIGIIRISGEEAFLVISRIFKPKDAFFDVLNPTTNVMKYGNIREGAEIVDEVLVSFFRAPHSYTTEDTVEVNCHGGIIIIKKILDLLIKSGARMAEPGEFTKRAFFNGRIDLAQAESVIDIISSKSDRARKAAMMQLKGDLSEKLRKIKKEFCDVLIEIEAGIDYPEHEIEEVTKSRIEGVLKKGKEELKKLYDTFDEGKAIKEGIKTIIIGKPNVGKSSLMNMFLREERSIVTDIPGTTRDTIEEVITIKGIPLCLVDTAGIRETKDVVEEIGVKRAIDETANADLIIAVFDLSVDITEEDFKIKKLIKDKKSIILVNKEDLERKWNPEEIFEGEKVIFVSLKNKSGREEIEKEIEEIWSNNHLSTGEDVIITNMRHKELIYDALSEIEDGTDALESDLPIDMISINIKSLAERIGEILGDNVSDDIIKGIFSRFCLGK